jgi:glucose/arabinose dehydrogenase
LLLLAALSGCRSNSDKGPGSEQNNALHFCDLPGSVRFTEQGRTELPGGPAPGSLGFLTLPAGYCAHPFANIGNARQLRFAPGGELFVASPTTGTTGGGPRGRATIFVLPDDDRDGVADELIPFLDKLPSTQGLLFANDHFYYQDGTKILRLPYAPGDRAPSKPGEAVVDINVNVSSLHWPKPLDQADDGAIYVGNGADQGDNCLPDRAFRGGILEIDGSPNGKLVSKGFRNPIAVRCQRGFGRCYAIELAMDYTALIGGREKLIPISEGDDWGFPCCFTRDRPAAGVTPIPDCSNVMAEDVSFNIGDTPFGFDFEPGRWPAPFKNSIFVALHGEAGSWKSARLVAIDTDPETGIPMPSTTLASVPGGGLREFASGWDDDTRSHGRPAALTFSEDGRLFLGNDNDGTILWIAPLDLKR